MLARAPYARRKAMPSRYVEGGALLCLSGVCALLLLALAGSAVAPHDPLEPAGPVRSGPSREHPFGTDQIGRDVLSRTMAGTQLSLGLAGGAVLSALVIGGGLGALAAKSSKIVDELIMRSLDVVVAFPGILLAIVLAAVLRPSTGTTLLVMGIVYVPGMARVVRGSALDELNEDYVTAAYVAGSSWARILRRHVMPNAVAPVLVYAITMFADAIILESALSFIGVGVPPPAPSWGNIVADGRTLVFSGGWWVSTFGGISIFATVLVLYSLARLLGGDGLRTLRS